MDGSNNYGAANGNANTTATTKNDEQHGSNNNDDTTDNNFLTTVNSTEESNTTTTTNDNDDPLASSINSTMPFLDTNKYHDLTDEQLQEFAKIVSPKVSDLLHEQEMLMVDLLDTSAWSSDSSNDDNNNNRKKQSKNKKKRRGQDDDDDSMNDEWDQLEVAQLNLKDELDAAALNYADMMMYDGQEEIGGSSSSREKGSSNINNGMRYSEEWSDSIHQYYTDNNNIPQSKSTAASATGRPIMPSLGLSPTTASLSYQPPPSRRNNNNNNNHSYTLADHARTLDISRTESNFGLYTKPLLSRGELQTLNIITIPNCISHPSFGGEVVSSSKTREMYIQHVLNCTVEYIEPIKSKYLRRMFSGWNSGPGERGSSSQGQKDSSSSQRVLAYVPPSSQQQGSGSNIINATNNDDNDDSSVDGDDDDNDGFEDINGVSYASHSSNTSNHRSNMEPLPVRTVTIRIRCDVLCGSVMDALSCSVEELGGEMTKRQGGHLRAVIPGRTMNVHALGTRERAREILEEINAVVGGESDEREESKDNSEEDSHDYEVLDSPFPVDLPPSSPVDRLHDDTSSVTSGISTLLSPILGTTAPNSPHSRRKGRTCEVLPPFIVDAQLVTKKVGKECQRLILIRTYRMQDVARVRAGMNEEESEAFDMIAPLDKKGELGISGSRKQLHSRNSIGADQVQTANPLVESKRGLQMSIEASALVQRIKAVGGSGFAINPQPMHDDASVSSHASTKSYLKSFGDAITSPIRYFGGIAIAEESPVEQSSPATSTPYPSVMELMTKNLLRKLIPSPSVGTPSKSALSVAKQKSNGIFPALSKEDQPYIKSSWILLRRVLEELDRRCLAYSTLGHCPLFQSPALPTVDVHFISQIKAFTRESMIVSLVKTASELEVFARETEMATGNVEQLLRPTFEMYKLTPPQLPNPIPLTAYPLDFRAPEEIIPPWGPDIASALDKISNDFACNDDENNQTKEKKLDPLTSVQHSEKAVSMIVLAFQKQNDEEQGARLTRKNLQVMDRLAKMQAHKRNSILKIRDSYGKNLLATKAGDEFNALRQKSSNIGSLADVINAAPDEVPLLICNALVGNAAGTCYVTHSHVLFNTQLLPVWGGPKVHLFSIMDVEVTINAPSKSVLSPLPASISFTTAVFGKKSTTREEVYNFIPSIGARRFAKFLEVLRDVALEDPNSLKFSEKGGLIYLAD